MSCPVPQNTNSSIDLDREYVRLQTRSPAKPKPLSVRKKPSQGQINPYYGLENPDFPPRTSSIRDHVFPYGPQHKFAGHRDLRAEGNFPVNDTALPVSARYRRRYLSDTSIEASSTDISTARSTLPSHEESYLSDTSSGIMGDFVPFEALDKTSRGASLEAEKMKFHHFSKAKKPTTVVNPYEFEPSSPFFETPARQTRITDFMKNKDDSSAPSPQLSHTKNSRSESNAIDMARPPGYLNTQTSKPTGFAIHRSESSPSVPPLQFPFSQARSPSLELPSYYKEDGLSLPSGSSRSRQQPHCIPHSYQDAGADSSRSPSRMAKNGALKSRSHSPSRQQGQELLQAHVYSRNLASTPTKTLGYVLEREELETNLLSLASSPPPSPPKKRSRSPMKKMFGDHGWLGQSPDEKPVQRLKSKKSFAPHNGDALSQKKTTMMGKLKNRLEEIAEKADLAPMFKSDHDKPPKLSVLSVSLSPPEQARIYMEVELMLVHTANNFLMTQFSQGRISMDSIKKTVDTWKSKGRPVVIEFMYDQATQRELVAANQHNFRFHGDTACNDIRINSMLYNWKQVANVMAIRTFCNADTILLKLLFDVEQILELLGAGEPMMVRLQQIRAAASENMRIARHNKDVKETVQTFSRGRAVAWNTRSSADNTSEIQTLDDPYGGLKLVPDSYAE